MRIENAVLLLDEEIDISREASTPSLTEVISAIYHALKTDSAICLALQYDIVDGCTEATNSISKSRDIENLILLAQHVHLVSKFLPYNLQICYEVLFNEIIEHGYNLIPDNGGLSVWKDCTCVGYILVDQLELI